MKQLLLIVFLFPLVVNAGKVSLGYAQDVVHAEGTAGMFLEYEGLFGYKPLRGILGAWRLSQGQDQGDNAYGGVEFDIINTQVPFSTNFIFGVGIGAAADRDSVIKQNELATFSFSLCGFNDKACAKFRHLSNPGVDDAGHNFLGVHFQTGF